MKIHQDSIIWLAKEIAITNEYGTKRLSIDWGNHFIDCDCEELKQGLIRLAREYLQCLKKLKDKNS